MNALGRAFRVIGYLIYLLTGLWAFVLCLGIVHRVAGGIGVVIALVIAPITLYLAPWYSGFAWHEWFPLLLGYGGGILAWLVLAAGTGLQHLANRGVRAG